MQFLEEKKKAFFDKESIRSVERGFQFNTQFTCGYNYHRYLTQAKPLNLKYKPTAQEASAACSGGRYQMYYV